MSTLRNFVFTINNPTEAITWWPNVRYAVYQKEVGANGTPHYQGYVELKTPERFNTVTSKLPRAHIELRKGSRQQARDYCMKEETRTEGPWEHGELKELKQGSRTDLMKIKHAIDEGRSLLEIEKEDENFCSMYRDFRHFEAYRARHAPKRNWKTKVWVFYGESGIGKSTWAERNFPNNYKKTPNCKWWDNYNGTDDIILDEFKGWLPHNTMCTIMDRFSCQVECKGGMVNFAPKNIVILTNAPWETWYDWDSINPHAKRAIERRIDVFHTDPNQDVIRME